MNVTQVYKKEGVLTDANQRIVVYAGAAVFVHPVTGCMIGHTLALANRTADVIVDTLNRDDAADEVSRSV